MRTAIFGLGGLALVVALSAQPAPPSFTGVVTDSMCARGDHKAMGMGDTDGECAKACVLSHGAEYVMFDGTHVWKLSEQQIAEMFAGERVRVEGSLNARTETIRMQRISRAK